MSFGPTHEIDATCPYCHRHNPLGSGVHNSRPPTPGDVGVCYGCAGIAVFDEDLSLRLPTLAELDDIERDPRLSALLASLKVRRD